jgi:hypothetical protein
MKQTEDKKLALNIETLRNLQPGELQQAAGGRAVHPTETEGAGQNVPTDTTDCFLTTTF